jgi:hypothetical protein
VVWVVLLVVRVLVAVVTVWVQWKWAVCWSWLGLWLRDVDTTLAGGVLSFLSDIFVP